MFEPLSDFIRLRRRQMGISQDKLAMLAKVSRRQLAMLEDGHNVSLLFLTKIAKVLEVTDIPVGNLRVFAAQPELGAVLRAAEAVEIMKQAFAAMGASAETINGSAAALEELVEKALAPPPSADPIDAPAAHLSTLPAAEGQAAAETLRMLTTDDPLPVQDTDPEESTAGSTEEPAERNGRG